MVGRTRESVWENMIKPLQDPTLFGPLAAEVQGTHLSGKVWILGREIRVMGASDEKAAKVIQGATVAGAMVDEVTTIPQSFFEQLMARMSPDGAQLFGTTNPDSPAHWFKVNYLDRIETPVNRLKGWTRWKFLMDDNPSLSAAYKRKQKRQYSGLFYRRFILGEWCAAAGAIFDFWQPHKYVVPHSQLPRMRRIYGVGVDFGTTHPSGAIYLGLGVDNVLYYLNEWSYVAATDAARISPRQQAQLLVAHMQSPLLPHADQEFMKPKYTIVDSAAPHFTLSLKELGVKNFASPNKMVVDGINTMSSMFTTGQLKVSDACVGLIAEIPGYSWDPKATARGEDIPIGVADDRIDPARYVLMTTQSAWFRDMAANR